MHTLNMQNSTLHETINCTAVYGDSVKYIKLQVIKNFTMGGKKVHIGGTTASL